MRISGATERMILIATALMFSASLGCNAMIGTIAEQAAKRAAVGAHGEWLTDDALHVFLCGTGSPLPDPERAAACTIVVAGGKVWVVDVGPGSEEVARLAAVPQDDLGGVLLTHFHSDHIGELGEWAMKTWAAGRTQPFHVYGPPGVAKVVNGFHEAYSLDDEYRIAHHGTETMPRSATEWVAHEVPYANGEGTVIVDAGGLVVKVFAVDHTPVEPAVGYRFDYKGRSVVISGDTDKSNNLELNAKGADLLVHEVLLKDVIGTVSDEMGKVELPRIQKIMGDILDYHTSPSEAVESARTAGVDRIVFTHMVPRVPGPLTKWLFTRNIDDGNEVDVVLGEDGMHFRLPAGSDAIEQENLID